MDFLQHGEGMNNGVLCVVCCLCIWGWIGTKGIERNQSIVSIPQYKEGILQRNPLELRSSNKCPTDVNSFLVGNSHLWRENGGMKRN
jgi:hypothetical protein